MATSSPATTGGLLAPHVLQDTWAKARAQDGIPDLHLHDPGHLAGTLAPSTGVGTRELMYPSVTPATKAPAAFGTPPSSATSDR